VASSTSWPGSSWAAWFHSRSTLEAVLPGGRIVLTLVTLQALTSPAVRFNAYLPADAATAALLGAGPTTPTATP